VAVFVAAVLGAPPAVVRSALPQVAVEPSVVVTLALSSLLLVVRRDFPRAVWIGTLVLAVGTAVLGEGAGRGLPAAVVALYTLASVTDRRWAVGDAAITVVVGALIAFGAATDGAGDPITFAVLPWCGLAAALGDTVRVNRRSLREAQERASLAEQTREEEALRRVAEERLRLSRELHDVIGHHLAVINVQAGVAEEVGRRDPDAAVVAMGQVREAAAEALRQTGRLVGLLREDEDEVPLEPAPHLQRLPELVEAARSSGVEVIWRQRGPVSTGDPSVDHHGFRIAQEALTNALRHGVGPVLLSTERVDGAFLIEVRNAVGPVISTLPATPGAASPSGHGLVGMRERTALCGGSLRVEQVGNEHIVRAELPVHEVEA
jgi:signal transduction histidine kinase